jgi:hypothetical protein
MPSEVPMWRLRRRRLLLYLLFTLLFAIIYLGMGNFESLPSFLSFSPETSGRPRKPTSEERIYAELQKPLLPTEYGTNARPPLKDIKQLVATLPKDLVPVPTAEREKDGDKGDRSWFGGSGSKHTPAKRLIIVGDVHGMRTELQRLLRQIKFDKKEGDHLILTGDMISKGPDSAGVVQMAMDLGASAVRGNHEDRVLLAHAALNRPVLPGTTGADSSAGQKIERQAAAPLAAASTLSAPPKPVNAVEMLAKEQLSRGDAADRATAANLSDAQREWLGNLPCILNVGPLPGSELRSVAIAHAGIVPRVSFERQDPFAVMNMRTLKFPNEELRKFATREKLEYYAKQRAGKLKPQRVTNYAVEMEMKRMEKQRAQLMKKGRPDPWAHDHDVGLPDSGRDGEPWSNVWDSWMQDEVAEEQRTTVVYGHDARRGFHMGKWTVGLDSGCVYGKKLSALIIKAGETKTTHEVVSVSCREMSKLDEDRKKDS